MSDQAQAQTQTDPDPIVTPYDLVLTLLKEFRIANPDVALGAIKQDVEGATEQFLIDASTN